VKRRVLLVAGEASGDLHGAALVREMHRLVPDLEVVGVGGEKLRAAGMTILTDTAEVQTMGFVETFGTLGRLVRTYRRLRRYLAEQRCDLVVLIDYPEFNLLLARHAKRLGVPVFYFIGPQVWAWRRGRVRKILRRVDRLALVFPFEPALYNVNGQERAAFVGHPLLDVVNATRSREETCGRYDLDPTRPVLALLPGSREKEISHLLLPMLEAARELAREGWQPVLALAPTLGRENLIDVLGRLPDLPIAVDDTYNVVAAADAVVVASGTATLETALLARPMVIVYRVAMLTYLLARALVRVDDIGMPNIVLGRRTFPELVQGQVQPQAIAAAVRQVAAHPDELRAALRQVRERLGEPGAAARAARLAVDLLA
jgi:lipid-A-disaccharide synthase